MSKIKNWFKSWIAAREREAVTRSAIYYNRHRVNLESAVDRADLDARLRRAGYGGI
jgi:hypothetical protein